MAIQSYVKHNGFKTQLFAGMDGSGWVSSDVRALLVVMGAWTPNPDDQFVQDAITAGAVELTTSGYARVSLASKTTSEDDTNDLGVATSDDIVFSGPPVAGDSYDALVLFVQETNDADSWLAVTYILDPAVTNGTPITFAVNPIGLLTIS